ncbi:MAG: T6SS effector amidase Tae4 family protein [Pseudomonadota bacterium]
MTIRFNDVWNNHPTNLSDQLPCRRANGFPTWSNQCAVRLGIALREAGVEPSKLAGPILCGQHPLSEMHFIRAQELANRIGSASIAGIGPTEKLTGNDAADFSNQLFGRKGLIFMRDYWTRTGERSPSGDHIDAWNGYRSTASWLMEYFSWLGYHGGYDKARAIWFWEMKD